MRGVYTSYKKLYEKYYKIIEPLADSLKNQARYFYQTQKVGGFAISDIYYPANEILIDDIVLNTVSDLDRIMAFHAVEKPTRYKYAAYIGFWWLRSKPFLCSLGKYTDFPELDDDTLDSMFLDLCKSANELFIIDVMLSLIEIKPMNPLCADKSKTMLLADLKDSLLYFLRYRQYSAQELELFLKGLKTCPFA